MTETAAIVALVAAIPATALASSYIGRSTAVPALIGMTVLTAFAGFLLGPEVSGWSFVALYVFLAAAPLLYFLYTVRRWDGGRIAPFGLSFAPGVLRTIAPLAAGLAAVYVGLTLEPGEAFGFAIGPPPAATTFALYLLTTPLLVLGTEAVFRGYFLTKWSERLPLPAGLVASAGLFTLATFDPLGLSGATAAGQGSSIFLNGFDTFLLGLFLAIFFFKTGWNLVGPVVFRSVLVGTSLLLPVTLAHVAWSTVFVLELLALATVLAVVFLVIREPKFQGRRYFGDPVTPRRRTLIANARNRRQSLLAGIVLVGAIGAILVVGPALTDPQTAPVRFLAIASGSMVPTFHVGDLVVLERVTSVDGVHVGDIVAYNAPYLSPEGPVVHRVTEIRANGSNPTFTTKGDHNPSADPRPVHFSQIYGVVVAVVPAVGYLVLSPALGLSIAALLMLVSVYRTAAEGAKRARRRPLLPIREEWQ